jgi:hypothetical protein
LDLQSEHSVHEWRLSTIFNHLYTKAAPPLVLSMPIGVLLGGQWSGVFSGLSLSGRLQHRLYVALRPCLEEQTSVVIACGLPHASLDAMGSFDDLRPSPTIGKRRFCYSKMEPSVASQTWSDAAFGVLQDHLQRWLGLQNLQAFELLFYTQLPYTQAVQVALSSLFVRILHMYHDSAGYDNWLQLDNSVDQKSLVLECWPGDAQPNLQQALLLSSVYLDEKSSQANLIFLNNHQHQQYLFHNNLSRYKLLYIALPHLQDSWLALVQQVEQSWQRVLERQAELADKMDSSSTSLEPSWQSPIDLNHQQWQSYKELVGAQVYADVARVIDSGYDVVKMLHALTSGDIELLLAGMQAQQAYAQEVLAEHGSWYGELCKLDAVLASSLSAGDGLLVLLDASLHDEANFAQWLASCDADFLRQKHISYVCI